MKIGMITIYRKNYGAFLQAYALQRAIIREGGEPEIIRYDYYHDNTFLGFPKESLPSLKVLLKKAFVEAVRYLPHKKRQAIFDESVKNNIIESKEFYKSYIELQNKPPRYHAYITGSDQVFNPCNNSVQALPARLLFFVKEGKKYSYAASAGSDTIPEKYCEQFRTALSSFTKVSVREEKLNDFFRTSYGIESERHIDPVFLLNSDEWTSFSKPVPELPEKYIFYYRVLPQRELNELAEEISNLTGLPIFVADGHDVFNNQVKRNGFLSPEQWVCALKNSTYVVTNSFHGASFAINLEKRATILVPPKGGERVLDLLKKCKMDSIIANPLFMYENENYVSEMAKKYIEEERVRSRIFLKAICTY